VTVANICSIQFEGFIQIPILLLDCQSTVGMIS